MSDPSTDDGAEPNETGRGDADAPDATPTADGSDGTPAADGSGRTATSAGEDPDPTTTAPPNDPEPSAVPDSPLRAVGVAVGLGTLGIAFVLLSSLLVFGIDAAVVELPLAVNLGLTLVLGQYVAFGGLALAYLLYRGFDRSGIVSYLGIRRPSLTELGLVLGGWVVILIMVVSISTLLQVIGAETAANQSAELAVQNPAVIPLLIAASFLVIGPAEEVLYRGIVQSRLRESISAVPAIAIASAIFAFVHVIALTGGIQGRLTTIAVLFFPSLVFGAVYEYTDNIVVPALLHGLHNAVLFTLLYVAVAYSDEIEELAEGGMALLPV